MSEMSKNLVPFGGWTDPQLFSRFKRWCQDPIHEVKMNPSMWNLMFKISLVVIENYGEIAIKYGLSPIDAILVFHEATVKRTAYIMDEWAKEKGLTSLYDQMEKEVDMKTLKEFISHSFEE